METPIRLLASRLRGYAIDACQGIILQGSVATNDLASPPKIGSAVNGGVGHFPYEMLQWVIKV